MLSYFGERISPHMTDTPEGYLICHDVPIGRTGEMLYLAGELQLSGDPERAVSVTREEDEVFSPAALASFEGKPVTDGHPPEQTVSPENNAAYSRGHVQNVRRSGEFVLADLHIQDPNLISEVKNGGKREVSCGYTCRYELIGVGYRQKQIRGNHVAVVPRGRAGHEVAIQDAAPAAGKGRKPMKKETLEALLRFFGLAARDVEPEELSQMTRDAATVVSPEPQTEPVQEPATDQVPPADSGLETKLDKLLELMAGLMARGQEKPHQDAAPEEKLDKTVAALEQPEGARTIEDTAHPPLDRAAADAAVRMLRGARPAIAAMKDPIEKQRVTDALLSSILAQAEDAGAKLLAATAGAAATAAMDSHPNDPIKAQQAAYDARNPHKNKREAL